VTEDEPDPDLLAALGLGALPEGARPVRGTGCAECGQSGYRGRFGVFEVLPVGQDLRRVLGADPSEAAVAAATSGLVTVRDAALAKALAGETTLEEVARVSPRE
jgi:type II secretory ATPase GspE/PulE/Tfp pilus assembly ATPase PilB-like protein